MTTKRRIIGGVAGLVIAVAAGVIYLMSTDGSGLADTPEQTASPAWIYQFDDVAQMTATADLVVKGTVTDTSTGRTHGADSGAPTTTRQIHLQVDEVIYQADPTDALPSEVLVGEGYWDDAGTGYAIEGMPWSDVGDTGYFFLSSPESEADTEAYGYLGPSARVMITDDGFDISGDGLESDPWAATPLTASADMASVEEVIADSAEQAHTGEATPAIPYMCHDAPADDPYCSQFA